MRYLIDHDYHIHSFLSLCSDDPEQNPESILAFAKKAGYKKIVLTDHYWDERIPVADINDFYRRQDTAHMRQSLPLPKDKDVDFRFGAEVDMAKDYTIGANEKTYSELAFIIIPTTHLHMNGFTIEENASLERRRELYIMRLMAVINSGLPAERTGIAHLTCELMAPESHDAPIKLLDGITDSTFGDLFGAVAKKGFGFELNFPIERYTGENLKSVLRPYKIAKRCGCKFYLGSDAHHPKDSIAALPRFEKIVDALELTEDDKFILQ